MTNQTWNTDVEKRAFEAAALECSDHGTKHGPMDWLRRAINSYNSVKAGTQNGQNQ